MTVLYIITDDITHRHNNFVRLFPPHLIKQTKVLDIKYNSYYIAGTSENKIYLGNTTALLHLLEINSTLTDTQHVRLTIKSIANLKFRNPFTKVNPPYFYIMDGAMPILLRGRINEWYATRFMFDSAYYTNIVPINSSSFALRTTSAITKEYILGKETAYAPHIKLTAGLLEKQIDGQFCTDGTLHYNKELQMLVYVYFYRNQYIVMDTNLNLAYRGKTIDTVSRAKIKIASINSIKAITIAAPPLVVNKSSRVYRNWLFINSNLMAKNETETKFTKASVIDVYNLKERTYQFSFYLHDNGKQKMRSFWVFDNTLVALYDHFIFAYELNSSFFK